MSNNYELFKPRKPIMPPPPPPPPPHLNPKVTNIFIDAGKNGTEHIYTTLGAMEVRLKNLEEWASAGGGSGSDLELGLTSGTAYPGNMRI